MSNRSRITEAFRSGNVKPGYILMIIGKQNKERKARNKRERQNRRKARK